MKAYHSIYKSTIGKLLLSASDTALTGAKFIDCCDDETKHESNPVLDMTTEWLEIYFSGKIPNFTPPILIDVSEFRKQVYEALLDIEYGTTATYKQIADIVAKRMHVKKMSCQAVGTALKNNPIAIVVPCHRIIKTDGTIGQYRYGTALKQQLLAIEAHVITYT